MKKYYLFLLGLCVLLVSCGSDPNDDPAFAPVVNPTPKYFMTVKGFIDPSLPKNLNLQIITQYETNNPACDYTVNSFEGVYSQRIRNITLTAQPDSKGNYVVKVPIDYFLAGKCEWAIEVTQFLPTNTGLSPILISYFTKPADLPKDFTYEQYTKFHCDEQLNCMFDASKDYDIDLPNNHNYIYQIDVRKQ